MSERKVTVEVEIDATNKAAAEAEKAAAALKVGAEATEKALDRAAEKAERVAEAAKKIATVATQTPSTREQNDQRFRRLREGQTLGGPVTFIDMKEASLVKSGKISTPEDYHQFRTELEAAIAKPSKAGEMPEDDVFRRWKSQAATVGPSSFVMEQRAKLAADVEALQAKTNKGREGAQQAMPVGPQLPAPLVGFAGNLKTAIAGGFSNGVNLLRGMAASPAMGAQKQGPIAGGFVDVITNATEGLKKFQTAALFASAASAGMVASMAPMTWSTFTGSIQLVGGQIANLLIPAFTSVSYWIQGVAEWIRNLDEGTKANISTVAKWGGGLLIGGAILTKLGGILLPVIGGVWLLAKAVVGVGAVILTSPFGLFVAGLSAAIGTVAYLTNGFGLLGNSIGSVGERADAARERMARLNQPGARATRVDWNTLDPAIRQTIEGRPAADRAGILAAQLAMAEELQRRSLPPGRNGQPANVGALQAQIEEILQMDHAAMDRRFAAMPAAQRNRLGAMTPTGTFRETLVAEALEQAGFNEAQIRARLRQTLSGQRSGTPADATARASSLTGMDPALGARIAILRNARDHGVPEVEGLERGLLSSNPQQPRSFSSGSDFYATVMQEALGRGRLELEILQTIMKNTMDQLGINQRQLEAMQALANPAP